MRSIRGELILVAQVGQNPVDNILLLYTGNDLYRSTAAAAGFNVDIEYSLESLRPGHRGVTLGW